MTQLADLPTLLAKLPEIEARDELERTWATSCQPVTDLSRYVTAAMINSAQNDRRALLHLVRELQQQLAAERGRAERAVSLLGKFVDIGQRRLNGGPYCAHVDEGKFCGRAERWAGHKPGTHYAFPVHEFVDGEWLIAALSAQSDAKKEGGE